MYAWGRGDGEGGGRERGRDLKDTALQVNCERAPESEVRRLAILDLYILHTHMHIYIYRERERERARIPHTHTI
jgi:hypothetical protein